MNCNTIYYTLNLLRQDKNYLKTLYLIYFCFHLPSLPYHNQYSDAGQTTRCEDQLDQTGIEKIPMLMTNITNRTLFPRVDNPL